jgi:RNA polymerase sigma-70 factor (sigma-E family)
MAPGPRRDQEAFSAFVTARSTALFRVAYLLMGDHQLAQDLLQEALAKTYVAWPRLRDIANAEPYTRKVMATTAISWRRRRSFHERPAEHLPETTVGDFATAYAVHEALWRHVVQLPPRQRVAVVLRHYLDLSESQTAETMGCSVGAVKSSVSTALRTLRERMGPEQQLVPTDDQAVSW